MEKPGINHESTQMDTNNEKLFVNPSLCMNSRLFVLIRG